jgi:hypothetical protein
MESWLGRVRREHWCEPPNEWTGKKSRQGTSHRLDVSLRERVKELAVLPSGMIPKRWREYLSLLDRATVGVHDTSRSRDCHIH